MSTKNTAKPVSWQIGTRSRFAMSAFSTSWSKTAWPTGDSSAALPSLQRLVDVGRQVVVGLHAELLRRPPSPRRRRAPSRHPPCSPFARHYLSSAYRAAHPSVTRPAAPDEDHGSDDDSDQRDDEETPRTSARQHPAIAAPSTTSVREGLSAARALPPPPLCPALAPCSTARRRATGPLATSGRTVGNPLRNPAGRCHRGTPSRPPPHGLVYQYRPATVNITGTVIERGSRANARDREGGRVS